MNELRLNDLTLEELKELKNDVTSRVALRELEELTLQKIKGPKQLVIFYVTVNKLKKILPETLPKEAKEFNEIQEMWFEYNKALSRQYSNNLPETLNSIEMEELTNLKYEWARFYKTVEFHKEFDSKIKVKSIPKANLKQKKLI